METVGKRDTPTAVVVVDPNGVVSGWSEGARELLGWSAQEAVGRSAADLLVDPPAGLPGSRGAFPGPGGVMTLRHQNGSAVDTVVTAHPLHGPEGRSLGRAVTVQRWDRRPVIADRAFEQCPFALGVYDPELRFLWVNRTACEVMAHSEEHWTRRCS